ncbi:MAG: hypothetical protein K6F00_11080 [Lachnospiraceae bacterium]|nr:hypothetical protein [Lachnospiraceae bacterium]
MDIGDISSDEHKKKLKGDIFLEEYYGKPIEEIGVICEDNPVINWGKPSGEEIW